MISDSVHVNMKPCSGKRHVKNIGMPVTFNTCSFFFYSFFFAKYSFLWGKHCDFLIFESLLKMSLHVRHVKAYTTRIYTMQYAYHICNDIDPG